MSALFFLAFFNLVEEIFKTTFHNEPCICKLTFFVIFGKLLYEEGNDDLVGIYKQGRNISIFNSFYLHLKSFSFCCLPLSIHLYGINKSFCYHCSSGIYNSFLYNTAGYNFASDKKRTEPIKNLHGVMRTRWVKCPCFYQDVLQPLREWRRSFETMIIFSVFCPSL